MYKTTLYDPLPPPSETSGTINTLIWGVALSEMQVTFDAGATDSN